MSISYNQETNSYYFECLHCHAICEVSKEDINCQIFRHGVYKEDQTQLDPHASKEVCEFAKKNNLIWGCGKPLRFDGEHVMICDYI